MKLLLRLYPAAWRARYEDEFLALLEERPLSPFDFFDITLGALDARLRPRSLAIDLAPRRTIPMNSRVSGYAAIAGGGMMLLLVAIALAIGPSDGNPAVYLFPAAAVALLVALIGLSAAQGRRLPALTWLAAAVPAFGLVAALLGFLATPAFGDRPIVGDLSPWGLMSLGVASTIVGSILFAAATLVVGVLSRGAAVSILAGSAVLALVGLPIAFGAWDAGDGSAFQTVLIAAGVVFCLGWMWLGYSAAFPASASAPRVEPT